jgi:hypothetical protein
MTENEVQSRPPTTFTCLAARLSFGLVAAFLFLLLLLHFLEPEFDPSWRLISEYELGRQGWMMSLAFFCLGFATLALVGAIWFSLRTSSAGRIGRWWLLLIGIAFIGAGIFVTDTITETNHSNPGIVHSLCGAVVILSFPIVATLIGKGLAATETWAGALWRLRWATSFVWIGFLSFFVSALVFNALRHPGGTGLGPEVLVGWPNRFMMVTYCAWLMTVSWLFSRRPSSKH